MLESFDDLVKLAVDVEQSILSGGGIVHADCEAILLAEGSAQEAIWGADWIPSTQEVRFEALINIRPAQDNPSMTILDESIRKQVEDIVRRLLGET